MRRSTRRNSSPRSSQRGMRCGAGRAGAGGEEGSGTGSITAADTGAGLAGKGGDVISGRWDIPSIHLPSALSPVRTILVRCKTVTGLQDGYSNGNTGAGFGG